MKQIWSIKKAQAQLLMALALSSGVSIGFFVIRLLSSHAWRYFFLTWNLFLAWLPLVFAWLLVLWLKKGRWLSWQGVLLTVLWAGFLPNSFYLLTDFIHLRATGEIGLLFDVVMLSSFAFNGLVLGFASVMLLHKQLLKRLNHGAAQAIVGLIFLLSSFAIYLGRYLRWNTWDILVKPAGIIFDISDRFINPAAYPRTFSTTASFFALLTSMYIVCWYFVAALSAPRE